MKTTSAAVHRFRFQELRLPAALKAHSAVDDVEAAVKWADALLADAMDARASDIHLDPHEEAVA